MKKGLRAFLIILCALAVLAGGVYCYYRLCMDPYRGTVDSFDMSLPADTVLTGAQAREDLEYFYEHIVQRHPKWLEEGDSVCEKMQRQYEAELAALGESESVLSVWQAAGRIVSILHDGHTWVDCSDTENELYIHDFSQLYEYGTPVKINGEATYKLLDKYKGLCSFETQDYAEDMFYCNAVVSKALLEYIGVDCSNGVTLTFNTPHGQHDFDYAFVPPEKVAGYETVTQSGEWLSFAIDKAHNAGIFTLSQCIDNEEYASALAGFFAEVNSSGVSNVIVDLRGNGGGSSVVANRFIQYLDVDEYRGWQSDVRFGPYLQKSRDVLHKNECLGTPFAGDVYVLTDKFTYSAAMDFAMLIGDNDIGAIVGEASGNRPDGYGDCLYFQLPNSKLHMSVSFKRWYRVDLSKNGELLTPDYETDPSDAMEKAFELIAAK